MLPEPRGDVDLGGSGLWAVALGSAVPTQVALKAALLGRDVTGSFSGTMPFRSSGPVLNVLLSMGTPTPSSPGPFFSGHTRLSWTKREAEVQRGENSRSQGHKVILPSGQHRHPRLSRIPPANSLLPPRLQQSALGGSSSQLPWALAKSSFQDSPAIQTLTFIFASLEMVALEPNSLEKALAMGLLKLFSGLEILEEKGTG